jgi:flagellar L-ring protein precursor FlgH
MNRVHRLLGAGALLLLGGCGILTNLSEIGRGPQLTPTSNPTTDPNWRPVTMPMPKPSPPPPAQANSLWRPGARAFFKDQRAARVGDIVTINVNMNHAATLNDNVMAQRTGSETMGAPNMFGLEAVLPKIIHGLNMASLASVNEGSNLTTIGQIQRNENVVVQLAGTITQVLPNGNLVVVARQEMRVNDELRQLVVTGVIRPEDIRSDNTVADDRIAEARIFYAGRGQLTQAAEPRWGDQLLQSLLPF